MGIELIEKIAPHNEQKDENEEKEYEVDIQEEQPPVEIYEPSVADRMGDCIEALNALANSDDLDETVLEKILNEVKLLIESENPSSDSEEEDAEDQNQVEYSEETNLTPIDPELQAQHARQVSGEFSPHYNDVLIESVRQPKPNRLKVSSSPSALATPSPIPVVSPAPVSDASSSPISEASQSPSFSDSKTPSPLNRARLFASEWPVAIRHRDESNKNLKRRMSV